MKGTFMANQVVTPSSQCLFCSLQQQGAQRIQSQNEYAFRIADAFPVTKGHSLIIPKRHIASFFDATEEERHAILALVDQAKAELDAQYQPAGYDLDINDGPAAGHEAKYQERSAKKITMAAKTLWRWNLKAEI